MRAQSLRKSPLDAGRSSFMTSPPVTHGSKTSYHAAMFHCFGRDRTIKLGPTASRRPCSPKAAALPDPNDPGFFILSGSNTIRGFQTERLPAGLPARRRGCLRADQRDLEGAAQYREHLQHGLLGLGGWQQQHLAGSTRTFCLKVTAKL